MSKIKFIMGILIFLSVVFSGGIAYGAENDDYYMTELEIIESINGECSIDLLYEQRGEYYEEREKNSRIIDAIDNRLEQLGVEEISYREVASKLRQTNNSSTWVALNPSSTVKWTSTRQTTVYRGKTYELQIVRGVPANTTNSELNSTDYFVRKSNRGMTAATQNVIGIAVSRIAGALPVVGGTLSTIQTLYDVCNGVVSGMTGMSSVSGVEANYTLSTSAEYLYVFVKYSGNPDAGYQILGYNGNLVRYAYSVAIPKFTMNGNVVYPRVDTGNYSGTIQSPYYNSYVDKASNNFYEYKNGNNNITQRYVIGSFYLENVLDSALITVPTPYSGY